MEDQYFLDIGTWTIIPTIWITNPTRTVLYGKSEADLNNRFKSVAEVYEQILTQPKSAVDSGSQIEASTTKLFTQMR